MRLLSVCKLLIAITMAANAAALNAQTSAVEPGRKTDFGYVRSIKTVEGVTRIAFDRAQLLTGKKAIAYSVRKGMGDEVPNDYIVVNDNRKLRDLVLAPSAKLYGTGILRNTTDPVPVTLQEFAKAISKYKDVPVNITYDNQLRVVRMTEQFFP
jgi:hypothetical protein